MDQKIGKSVVCYQKLLHLLILKITKIYRHEKIEKVTEGNFLPYRVRF